MRALQLWLFALLALNTAACRKTRCEDLQAAPIAGKYRGGGSLGEERLLNVALEATSKHVVLTYTAMDGSHIRAKYKVVERSEKR